MQNTILIVGPGTPASMVRTARSKPDSGTNCDEAEEEEKDSYSLSASDDIDDRQDGNEHLELQNDEDIEAADALARAELRLQVAGV